MIGSSSPELKQEQQQDQQQHPLQQRMVQPVLLLLSIGAFVLLLALGPSIVQQGTTIHQEEGRGAVVVGADVKKSMTTGTRRSNIRRALSTLTPPDANHANFFEYLPGTYDFIVRRREGDGALEVFVEVNPDTVQQGQSDTYIVDCPVVSQYRADCYDAVNQFNFTLDIFTFDQSAETDSTTTAALPNVLYTRPDGNVYSVYDPNTHWIHESDSPSSTMESAPRSDDSSSQSCMDKILRFFGYNAETDSDKQRRSAMWIASIVVISGFVTIVSLLILMVSTIRMIHRRSQYRKQLMNEIHLEGTIRYAPSTALPSMSSSAKMMTKNTSSSSSSNIKKNISTKHQNKNNNKEEDDDDHTEMMEFSDDSDDVDPTELREVDLSR